jgi:hypothetical protein
VIKSRRKRFAPASQPRCQPAADHASVSEVLISAAHFLTRVARVLAHIAAIIPVIATIIAAIDASASR